ncbi:MAG: anaerobic ribonucleoside-triphosphate reductase [Nanoarchaeota archaeon]
MIIPKAIETRDKKLKEFSIGTLTAEILRSAQELGGEDKERARIVAEKIGERLFEEYGKIVKPEQIEKETFDILKNNGHEGTAYAYHIRCRKRTKARNAMVFGSTQRKGSTDKFLMVGSLSSETSAVWDRSRIVRSLINEATLDLSTAESVSEEAETHIFSTPSVPSINTQLIREVVHTELVTRGLDEPANDYRNFGIPKADLEELIFSKIEENANVNVNNPEAINFGLSGGILKAYALNCLFSEDVAQAHTNGAIHLHDLDMPTRLYCSAHSLEYLKTYGLKLKSLSSSSSFAKHSDTLIGHVNTYLATMQAYYAGALGIGDINVFFAPHLQKDLEEKGEEKIELLENENKRVTEKIDRLKTERRDVTSLEELVQENSSRIVEYKANPISILNNSEIDRFLGQQAQKLLYQGSQNAFSRGGQTLFLDFNIHASIPRYLEETPIILDGKYQLRDKSGKFVALEKRKLNEKTRRGYNLMELVDPRNNGVVLREKIEMVGKKEHIIQDKITNEGENIVMYGDYKDISRRFTKELLEKFGEGDEHGIPFPFPKCDFHISEDSLDRERNKEDSEVVDYACEVASKNGSVYFVMDRDAVTMSACCRLRTTIEDDYLLKHPESIRFCGFQNVTINLPQAAYRAKRRSEKDQKSLEELFREEVGSSMNIAKKAHLQKKEFIERLQQPGGPQYQTGDICLDGTPYVDLNDATYIIGILGLNEAGKVVVGKELHEMSPEEMKNFGLKTVAYMNTKTREFSEAENLKFSLEESPAESATRRLSLVDLSLYPESKNLIKGNIKTGDVYYSNSVHPAADAPIDMITRVKMQGSFHPAIDSGAITHAFVGEHRPSADSIRNLVEKTFEKTQTAQLTISPEFTVCESCNSMSDGLYNTCKNCGSEEVFGITRIVGYYSKIPNWNRSKLQELDARHQGKYIVGDNGGKRIEPPQLELSSSEDELVVHRYGKPGCSLCEDVGRVIRKSGGVIKKKYKKIMREICHDVHSVNGMTEFLTAGLNPSRLPAVVVTDKDGEVYRQSTQYREDGKAKLVTVGTMVRGIEDYLKK